MSTGGGVTIHPEHNVAIVSGDEQMMGILRDPDPEWAVLKKGNPYGVDYARVAFMGVGDSGIPTAKQNPSFIGQVWVEGKFKAVVADEWYVRNEDGSIKHRGYDIHWSIAERIYERPREEMIEKVHRNAGKVINFSCVPWNSYVSTNCRPLKISDINSEQKVWDGVDWVCHEQPTYQGIREVIRYSGCSATPEHVVWRADTCEPICLIDAAMLGLELANGGSEIGLRLTPRHSGTNPEGDALERRVQELRRGSHQVVAQLEQRRIAEVSVPPSGSIQGQASIHAGPTLLHGHARFQPQLQGAGDQSHVQATRVYRVGIKDLANGSVHRTTPGVRPDFAACEEFNPDGEIDRGDRSDSEVVTETYQEGQGGEIESSRGESRKADRRKKFEISVAASSAVDEAIETGERDTDRRWLRVWYTLAGVDTPVDKNDGGSSGSGLLGGLSTGAVSSRKDSGGNYSEVRERVANTSGVSDEVHEGISKHLQQGDSDDLSREGYDVSGIGATLYEEVWVVPVYDLINAGPRHRFTLSNGVIVSNSAYGASPASLERKIESDTGVKPEEGVGQKGLDAIRVRQPRASEFLDEMAEIPTTVGYYRAASGRIRHCTTHGAGSGVNWRMRQSQASALGREMKNFPMQESVGSTSARACKMALRIYRSLGLKARLLACLYDSMVSLCPLEERELVLLIHQLVMSDWNTWDYNDAYGKRVLKYEIDSELNKAWSTKPPKDLKEKLEDFEWHPTPDRLKPWLNPARLRLLVS